MNSPRFKEIFTLHSSSINKGSRGIGLVLTLAMITLTTVIVLAFLNQVNNSFLYENLNAQKTKTKLLSTFAKEYIISQFIHEIVIPQHSYQPNLSNENVFIPLNPTNAVPLRIISNDIQKNNPYFFNLIRQSVEGGDPNASSHSTSSPSKNNFYISEHRWNAPELLSESGFTSNNQLPDWIYIDLKKGATAELDSSSQILGRFSYNVYNVGNLIDINVAGYPSGLDKPSLRRIQNTLAGADLTQLPGVSAEVVDKLVFFRNPQCNTKSYADMVESLSGVGFMKPYATNLFQGDQRLFENNFFSSRQDLIHYVRTQNPGLEQALPYLTTYSRDQNQPLIAPSPERPKIVSDIGNSPYINYSGGNSGFGKDDKINPVFPSVRLSSPILRNDKTRGVIGDLLVNRRFALENLAWITCKGPSSILSDADPVISALHEKNVPAALIQKGTAENIRNHFGLVWNASKHYWMYAPGAPETPLENAPSIGSILALDEIKEREPNFIELLKASIHAGSLGKSLGVSSTVNYVLGTPAISPLPQNYFHIKDSSIDYQIVQIAANIIDQADPDGYPTRIQFNLGNNLGATLFAGIEDLPYLYRLKNLAILVRPPSPLGTGAISDSAPFGTYPVVAPGGIYDPGCGVLMIVPEIWNPHDQNGSTPDSRIRPGSLHLRVVADNTDPISAQAGISGPANLCVANNAGSTGGAFPSSYSPGFSLNPSSSALVFGDGNGQFFREPTSLRNPNIPTGSDLKTASVIPATAFSSTAPSIPGASLTALLSPTSTGWSLRDCRVGASNPNYIGIYLGYFPLIKPTRAAAGVIVPPNSVGDGAYISGVFKKWYNALLFPNLPFVSTFRVQCLDPFGDWIDYDTKYCVPGGGSGWRYLAARHLPDSSIGQTLNEALLGMYYWGYAFDPRTSRFQMQFDSSDIVIQNPLQRVSPVFDPKGLFINYTTWFQNGNAVATQRPAYNFFTGQSQYIRFSSSSGLVSQKTPEGLLNVYQDSLLSQNNPNADKGIFYYKDADGIVRRSMGAYTPPGYDFSGATTSNIGLPLSTATENLNNSPSPTVQSRSRPRILNRPFRHIAELGYVFRDVPWKNIDFFTPESGDSALLDLFCIHSCLQPKNLVAGKVNLNTPHQVVLQTLLNGAIRDVSEEVSSPFYPPLSPISETESAKIAEKMIEWSQKTPWTLMSDFVGRPVSLTSYTGFSKQVTSAFDETEGQESKIIQRFREAPVRSLMDVSTTSIWNLMIDVIIQNGKFDKKNNQYNENNFDSQGEERYWIHFSVNRFTGEVIDQKIESVYGK